MADEKVINIVYVENSLLITLTSDGRLFQRHFDGAGYGDWYEMDLPDLKKSKPRAQAKESAYTDDFEKFWSKWDAKGKGSKQDAFKQFRARFNERGGDVEYKDLYAEIDNGARGYFNFCKETGQFAMQVCRFLGNGKHYLNDFTIPKQVIKKNRVKQEWENIPENENHLIAFIEKHGFKKPDRMAKTFDVVRNLREEIRTRIEMEG